MPYVVTALVLPLLKHASPTWEERSKKTVRRLFLLLVHYSAANIARAGTIPFEKEEQKKKKANRHTTYYIDATRPPPRTRVETKPQKYRTSAGKGGGGEGLRKRTTPPKINTHTRDRTGQDNGPGILSMYRAIYKSTGQ